MAEIFINPKVFKDPNRLPKSHEPLISISPLLPSPILISKVINTKTAAMLPPMVKTKHHDGIMGVTTDSNARSMEMDITDTIKEAGDEKHRMVGLMGI